MTREGTDDMNECCCYCFCCCCGQVSERVGKLFADMEVNMLDGVPQNIRSYTVRSGHDSLDEVNKTECKQT